MRKFVRIAIIVCLSIAAIPAVLFGFLSLWIWYKTAQVESFYQEHRLLREMHTVQASGTTESGPAREALLRRLPLGTDREAAVAALLREGLGCRTIVEPMTDTRFRERFKEDRGLTGIPNDSRTGTERVDCGAATPNIIAYSNWIVSLEFDADRHLSDAHVATWSIFL